MFNPSDRPSLLVCESGGKVTETYQTVLPLENSFFSVTLGDCCHVPSKSASMRHGVTVPSVSHGPPGPNFSAERFADALAQKQHTRGLCASLRLTWRHRVPVPMCTDGSEKSVRLELCSLATEGTQESVKSVVQINSAITQ